MSVSVCVSEREGEGRKGEGRGRRGGEGREGRGGEGRGGEGRVGEGSTHPKGGQNDPLNFLSVGGLENVTQHHCNRQAERRRESESPWRERQTDRHRERE